MCIILVSSLKNKYESSSVHTLYLEILLWNISAHSNVLYYFREQISRLCFSFVSNINFLPFKKDV